MFDKNLLEEKIQNVGNAVMEDCVSVLHDKVSIGGCRVLHDCVTGFHDIVRFDGLPFFHIDKLQDSNCKGHKHLNNDSWAVKVQMFTKVPRFPGWFTPDKRKETTSFAGITTLVDIEQRHQYLP